MDTQNSTFSVTDLRHKTSEVMQKAQDEGVVFVVQHSRIKAALVDPEYLSALQKSHEDYLDILEYDQTIGLPRITVETHKRRSKTT